MAPLMIGMMPAAANPIPPKTTTMDIHQNRFFRNFAFTSPNTIKSPPLDNSLILLDGPYTKNVSNAWRTICAIFFLKIVPSRRMARMNVPNRRRKFDAIKLWPTKSDCSVNKHSTNTLSCFSNSCCVNFSSVNKVIFSTSFMLRKLTSVPRTNRISPALSIVWRILVVIIFSSRRMSKTITS